MLGTAALIERAVVQHVVDGGQHRGGNYADGLWGSAATTQASKRRGAHNWRCLSRARRISDCTYAILAAEDRGTRVRATLAMLTIE